MFVKAKLQVMRKEIFLCVLAKFMAARRTTKPILDWAQQEIAGYLPEVKDEKLRKQLLRMIESLKKNPGVIIPDKAPEPISFTLPIPEGWIPATRRNISFRSQDAIEPLRATRK
mgnify:CR=1 FL=1